MSDLISRQQAIDALCKSECGCSNAECRHKDDADFCVTCDSVKIIMSLPSAQPEIIRCKDCAYCDSDVVDVPYGMTKKVWWCDRLYAGANENLIVEPDDFCSWAERRE